MPTFTSFHVRTSIAATLIASSAAMAADLEVIHSTISTSPTSDVPGALDLLGNPVPAKFMTLFTIAVRTDADEWVLRGANNLGADLANILIRGNGVCGTNFLQEGQPVIDTNEPGEVWDFFDTVPASWNSKGDIAYSARARGGVTTNNEKLFTYSGGVHTLLLEQGSSLTGLPSNPAPNPTCTSPTVGNSIGGVAMLDTGEVVWGNAAITGCSSFLYPAIFKDHAAWILTAPSIALGGQPILAGAVGEECIEDGSFDTAIATRDGLSFVWEVTTNNPNTAGDYALVQDWNIVVREGQAIAGTTVLLTDVFNLFMATNDDWYARGDDPASNDWAARNNVMLAKTGDPITTGSTELWGVTIGTFCGNGNGDWIIAGNTNNPDLNADNVLVLNGEEVLIREGDPVDVDGDGLFDDDAFISTFVADNAYLTDDMVLYCLCGLRNGAATSLGNAFIRSELQPVCDADIDDSTEVDVNDLLAVITTWGPCPGCPATPCPADISPECPNCEIDVNDLLLVITTWGSCK